MHSRPNDHNPRRGHAQHASAPVPVISGTRFSPGKVTTSKHTKCTRSVGGSIASAGSLGHRASQGGVIARCPASDSQGARSSLRELSLVMSRLRDLRPPHELSRGCGRQSPSKPAGPATAEPPRQARRGEAGKWARSSHEVPRSACGLGEEKDKA